MASRSSPLPPADAEEEADIAEAVRRSLAELDLGEFELVPEPEAEAPPPSAVRRAAAAGYGAGSASSSTPAAKAAAKLAARPSRTQPLTWYTVTCVRAGAESSLGVHYCRWDDLRVPGGRLCGSGWNVRRSESKAEAVAKWHSARPSDACPDHSQ